MGFSLGSLFPSSGMTLPLNKSYLGLHSDYYCNCIFGFGCSRHPEIEESPAEVIKAGGLCRSGRK